MRVWKRGGSRSVLSFVLVLATAGSASAQCKICDQYLHCAASRLGALVCLEGYLSCGVTIPCTGGGGRESDENLTTWTLFDAEPAAGSFRAAVRAVAGPLALGDEARIALGARPRGGPVADAALAYGREYAIVLADALGDGFALRRAVEAERVRLEVSAVRGNRVGAVLASEALTENQQLSVPVIVEGRPRVLVLQAGAVHAWAAASELARIRRSLAGLARTVPERREPLLRQSAR